MALFKSRFSELGFYVGGSLKRFVGGKYKTNNKTEIAVLEKLKDVSRIDEPKPTKVSEPKAEITKEKTASAKK